MAGFKIKLLLFFVVFYVVIDGCKSIPSMIPPNLFGLASDFYPALHDSPSDGPMLGPNSKLEEPSSPVPASPSYLPVPSPDSNSKEPSSPAYLPVPMPSPNYYRPVPASPSYLPVPSPDSSSTEPSSPAYLPMPMPSPNYYSPVPASPSYLPVPGPNSYLKERSSPAYLPVPMPSPTYYRPVPASPSLPVPVPDSNLAVPTSPPLSIPGPIVLTHDSYPLTPEPAPISYPPKPTSTIKYLSPPVRPSQGVKAAYWPSFDGFPASSIETSYFTHLYYAFLLPDPATYKLAITSFDQKKLPEFIGALQTQDLPVKTILSIGGGGNDPAVFSQMASSKSTRAIFINSAIEVARKYGFDGLDLDWEFPANEEDMSNLALLYKQWRQALDKEAKTTGKPRLLLTSAVYYASKFSGYGEPRSYPGDAIRKYLDWVNPMCFDYHGSWENIRGQQSALYDPNSDISTNFGIGSWIQAGVPPKKLVMGLPLYGRTWKLRYPKVNGIGAPAVGVGPGDGTLFYYQVVDFNNKKDATVKFDSQTVSFYSYAGDSWIGYDDVRSIKLKIQFARSRGLGGYFFWALGQDKDWTLSRQASNAWGN